MGKLAEQMVEQMRRLGLLPENWDELSEEEQQRRVSEKLASIAREILGGSGSRSTVSEMFEHLNPAAFDEFKNRWISWDPASPESRDYSTYTRTPYAEGRVRVDGYRTFDPEDVRRAGEEIARRMRESAQRMRESVWNRGRSSPGREIPIEGAPGQTLILPPGDKSK